MHITVPLAVFCLDALQLNEELCNRTQNLKDRLIEFAVMENRALNTRYMLLAHVVLVVCIEQCCISVGENFVNYWAF